jgi:protein-disulfide isomerase
VKKTLSTGFLALGFCWSFTPLCLIGCGKKPPPPPADAVPEAPKTTTGANSGDSSPPSPSQPVQGANLDGLAESQKNRFERLVDTLNSPCGKAHSLRTSRNTDPSCARAPFAVAYVIELLKDNATNKEVRELYERRYRDIDTQPRVSFDLAGAPKTGSPDAPVELVEFYDYQCPACRNFKGALEEAAAELSGKVVVYYKQFPLPGHQPGAGVAAQAALAVQSLEPKKFKAMHDWLFANPDKHTREGLQTIVEELHIKPADFDKAYEAAAAKVEADRAEGMKDKRVESTPTLFINGRPYGGPQIPKYIKMFVEEAIAVGK